MRRLPHPRPHVPVKLILLAVCYGYSCSRKPPYTCAHCARLRSIVSTIAHHTEQFLLWIWTSTDACSLTIERSRQDPLDLLRRLRGAA